MAFSFETLVVWQKARVLAREVYKLTRAFPSDERIGLTNQIRRAVVSVVSNLAEGSGRMSKKEKIHFAEIAYGSLSEVLCQLIIAEDLGYVPLGTVTVYRPLIEEIGRLINGYHASLEHKQS